MITVVASFEANHSCNGESHMAITSSQVLNPSAISIFCNLKMAPLLQQDRRVLEIVKAISENNDMPKKTGIESWKFTDLIWKTCSKLHPKQWKATNHQKSHCQAIWEFSNERLELYYVNGGVKGPTGEVLIEYHRADGTQQEVTSSDIYIEWNIEYKYLTPILASGKIYLLSTETMQLTTWTLVELRSSSSHLIEEMAKTQEEFKKLLDTLKHQSGMPYRWAYRRDWYPKAVCCIYTKDATGRFIANGTGFVIAYPLLMTSKHVLPDASTCGKSYAEFFFHDPSLNRREIIDLDPTVFWSCSGDARGPLGHRDVHDFAIVRLRTSNETSERLKSVFNNPISLDEFAAPIRGRKFTVFHHALGMAQQRDLSEHEITEVEENYFNYSFPSAAAGASGSAVLDSETYRLIGIHRQATSPNGATHAAIRIDKICVCLGEAVLEKIRKNYSTVLSNPQKQHGNEVLFEHLKINYSQHSSVVPILTQFATRVIAFNSQDFILPQIVEEGDDKRQKLITLDELFFRLHEQGEVLRAAIYGDGGAGKTTLCQYIIYSWSTNSKLTQHFDWVFFIPLDELNKEEDIDLIDVIFFKYFKNRISQEAFVEFWRIYITDSNRVLFLFDGYDQFKHQKRFSTLLNPFPQVHVLITSRRYAMDTLHMYKKLFIKGFKEDDICKFIRDFFNNKNSLPDSLITYIFKNKICQFSSIVQTPLLLDLLCRYWLDNCEVEAIKEKGVTITSVYYQLILSLIMNHFNTRQDQQLLRLIEAERKGREYIAAWSSIAFLSVVEGEYGKIPPDIIDKALIDPSLNIADLLIFNILVFKNSEYSFIHPTFQEYFAACGLIDLLKQNSPNAQAFISKNKYNPRLQLIFRFAAGLCILEDKKSKIVVEPLVDKLFSAYLSEGTLDLIGKYEASLGILMLEESAIPDTTHSQELQKRIARWIAPNDFYTLVSTLNSCPKYKDKHCLFYASYDLNEKTKIEWCRYVASLKYSNEKVISQLMTLSDSEEPQLQRAAFDALTKADKRGLGWEKVCKKILAVLQQSEEHIVDSCDGEGTLLYNPHTIKTMAIRWFTEVLSEEVPEQNKRAVIEALHQADRDIQEIVLEKLGEEKSLDFFTIQMIITFLNSSDNEVKKCACKALRYVEIQDNEQKEKAIRLLAKFPSSLIKVASLTMWALKAFDKVFQNVLSLLKSASLSERKSGCELVRELKSSNLELVEELVKLLSDQDLKQSACLALKHIENVEPIPFNQILPLLKDPNTAEVASLTLVKHKISDQTCIQAVALLLNDRFPSIRKAAYEMLYGLIKKSLALSHIAALVTELNVDSRLLAYQALIKLNTISQDHILGIAELLTMDQRLKLIACDLLLALKVSDVDIVKKIAVLLDDVDQRVKIKAGHTLLALKISDNQIIQKIINNLIDYRKPMVLKMKSSEVSLINTEHLEGVVIDTYEYEKMLCTLYPDRYLDTLLQIDENEFYEKIKDYLLEDLTYFKHSLSNAKKLLILLEKYYQPFSICKIARFFAELNPALSPSPLLFDNLLTNYEKKFAERWPLGLQVLITLCSKFGNWRNNSEMFFVYANRIFDFSYYASDINDVDDHAIHIFDGKLFADGIAMDVPPEFAGSLVSELAKIDPKKFLPYECHSSSFSEKDSESIMLGEELPFFEFEEENSSLSSFVFES